VRKFLITIVLLGLLSFVGMFLTKQWYESLVQQELNISDKYTLLVNKGAGLSSIANQLQKDELIDSVLAFKLLARVEGTANEIKAGEYLLNQGVTPKSLLDILVEGDVVLHQVTIPEGFRFREMLDLLHRNTNLKATLKGKSDAEIMQQLGYPDQHPEGLFLPETYRFEKNSEDVLILKQAYQAMQEVLANAWEQKSEHSVLKSPYEALILASIIEKETGVFDEQATIAGVFNSRLLKGMRLQTDPTVIYGMGDNYAGDIRRRDLQTDTPYNTYTRSGLTPTPISLPGKNAIFAAVNPEIHDKLYFVATGDGDGRHYFSASLEEHNQAVQRYLKKYRAKNN